MKISFSGRNISHSHFFFIESLNCPKVKYKSYFDARLTSTATVTFCGCDKKKNDTTPNWASCCFLTFSFWEPVPRRGEVARVGAWQLARRYAPRQRVKWVDMKYETSHKKEWKVNSISVEWLTWTESSCQWRSITTVPVDTTVQSCVMYLENNSATLIRIHMQFQKESKHKRLTVGKRVDKKIENNTGKNPRICCWDGGIVIRAESVETAEAEDVNKLLTLLSVLWGDFLSSALPPSLWHSTERPVGARAEMNSPFLLILLLLLPSPNWDPTYLRVVFLSADSGLPLLSQMGTARR